MTMLRPGLRLGFQPKLARLYAVSILVCVLTAIVLSMTMTEGTVTEVPGTRIEPRAVEPVRSINVSRGREWSAIVAETPQTQARVQARDRVTGRILSHRRDTRRAHRHRHGWHRYRQVHCIASGTDTTDRLPTAFSVPTHSRICHLKGSAGGR